MEVCYSPLAQSANALLIACLFFNEAAMYVGAVASWADADGFVCCLVSAVDAASSFIVVVVLIILHFCPFCCALHCTYFPVDLTLFLRSCSFKC